jgi:hypothetical protein
VDAGRQTATPIGRSDRQRIADLEAEVQILGATVDRLLSGFTMLGAMAAEVGDVNPEDAPGRAARAG